MTYRRTIKMTPQRAHQIALASAYLGLSGEKFIARCIAEGLDNVSRGDPALKKLINDAAE